MSFLFVRKRKSLAIPFKGLAIVKFGPAVALHRQSASDHSTFKVFPLFDLRPVPCAYWHPATAFVGKPEAQFQGLRIDGIQLPATLRYRYR
jgi:hypothetical protein